MNQVKSTTVFPRIKTGSTDEFEKLNRDDNRESYTKWKERVFKESSDERVIVRG
jgi:hypothetical protein